MAIIEWTDDLAVNVPVLDGHHKHLFGLLGELYDAVQSGGAADVVAKVLGELLVYTKYHFSEEERLLEEAGFPNLDAHKRIHLSLAAKVANMCEDYTLDPRTVYAAELYEFLSGWLVNHIKGEDYSYRDCLAKA